MFIVLNTMVFYTFILVIIRRKEFIGQRRDDAAPLNRVVVDDEIGNDSNLLIVFYVQIMPDDLVMQLHRF